MTGAWLDSCSAPRGQDTNSNLCTNVQGERRKGLVIMRSVLCREVQRKYLRMNDSKIRKYSSMVSIQLGLTKGRSFPPNWIPVFSCVIPLSPEKGDLYD